MQELIVVDSRGLTVTEPGRFDQNAAAVYLAGLTPSSRRPMLGALGVIAELLAGVEVTGETEAERRRQREALALATSWGAVRFQHTALLRSQLAARYKPATANRLLAALRGVLKTAWKLGQMNAEDYHRAAEVKGVKGETVPAGRSIAGGELSALMDACTNDPTPAGVRDAAILSILYSCGLRRAELVGADLADFDRATGSLKVTGKGRKERLAYPKGGALAALEDWLALRGDDPGPLFLQIRKGGHIRPGRLTTQAVYHILQERAGQSGVSDISPHDFRRSFVGDLLDAGADIVTVQRMAGHADVSTTARYDRRGEEAKQKAAELLHVPYRRRSG